ncbi:hypothetical protein [Paludisphaera sp.]|uniref:hypothetical protein n=1 Tax=Paludisphaera sp. TaxID=2017432 RepID=UPI00301E0A2A
MRRKFISLAVASLIVLGPASTVDADFFTISDPRANLPNGQGYTSGTRLLAIPGDQFDLITSLPDAGVTFSIPLMILDVPDGWATWAGPPITETDTPRVLYSDGLTQVTLTFADPLSVFGFELQPNQFGPFTFTATFFNGADEVYQVSRDVGGDAGALLFAAATTALTPAFTSVRISGSQDFGIAQLRFAPAEVVPEPNSLMLLAAAAATGALVAASSGHRRRREPPGA